MFSGYPDEEKHPFRRDLCTRHSRDCFAFVIQTLNESPPAHKMGRERVIPVVVTGQHSGMAEADKPPSERPRNVNAFGDGQFFETRPRHRFMNMGPTPYETTFGVNPEPENEIRPKETPIRVHVVVGYLSSDCAHEKIIQGGPE